MRAQFEGETACAYKSGQLRLGGTWASPTEMLPSPAAIPELESSPCREPLWRPDSRMNS